MNEISITDANNLICQLLRGIKYTESDYPLADVLNGYFEEVIHWFTDMIEQESEDINEFNFAIDELIHFGDHIIKDSFLKCRKVKALCVLV